MKKRKKMVQRLLTTLLCMALCATDVIPAGMTVWAQEPEFLFDQEKSDTEGDISVISDEWEAQTEAEPSPEKDAEEETGSAAAEGTAEEAAENLDQEADEPAEDEPPVKEGDGEVTLPVEEEQESVSENAVEEDVVEEAPTADFVMAASDGDIASGTYYNTTWKIDADGKLTVTGTGDFVDPSYKGSARAPWYRYRFQIKTAEINLSGVTDASYMFYNSRNLTSIDMTHFDTSSVTDMRGMFNDCASLSTLDLGNEFHTGSVTDMSGMFSGCECLPTLDVSHFDTGSVTDMNHMFYNCRSLPKLDVSNFKTSEVTDMNYMFSGCRSLPELDVSNFKTGRVTDMEQMFYGCSSLPELEVSDFDTSSVTNMRYMFAGCGNLSTLNVSNFTTNNVTKMDVMFSGCKSLTELEVSNFTTDSVTDMRDMFRGCASLTTLDVSHFDTNSVTDMSFMFYGCSKLTELDLSSEFHTGSVTNMLYMFAGCGNLITLNVSNFTTNNVTDMRYMFSGCESLTELDLSSFDTQNVTDTTGIFDGCTDLICIHTPCNLTQYVSLRSDSGDTWCRPDGTVMIELPRNLNYSVILRKGDIPTDTLSGKSGNISWEIDTDGKLTVSGTGDFEKRIDDVTKVKAAPWYAYRTLIKTAEVDVRGMTDASYMFYECINMTGINLTNFYTSSVTNMESMFHDCENLTTLNLDNFNPWQVTNMNSMFAGCEKLTDLDLSEYNTSSVTDMSGMFEGCSKLTTLRLSNFSNDIVTDISRMFYGCERLKTLSLSNFNSGSVTDMSYMFYGCEYLQTLNLSSFNTSNVTNMSSMFAGCKWLHDLDLKDFNTSSVTDMSSMFDGCRSLTTLDLSSFDTSKVAEKESMFDFDDCEELTGIYTPLKLSVSVGLPGVPAATWYYSDNTTATELPKNLDYSVALKKNEAPADIASDTSEGVSWVINANRKLTVSGSGDFERTDDRYAPWYNYCKSIKTAEITVTDMTDASGIFLGCEYLTSIDLTKFDTSKVTNMSEMFGWCKNLTTLDVSKFNTGSVTDMSRMFYSCLNLTGIDLTKFDTGKVTDMSGMFSGCRNLPKLDVISFKTDKVTDMSSMFDNCENLLTLDVSSFNTGSVTNMSWMFSECDKLTTLTLDANRFDTSNVTDMQGMFCWSKNLTTLDVGHFDTGSVTDMSSMFSACQSLPTLDVSHFDTGSVTDMSSMFSGCYELTKLTLDVNRFDTGNVTDMRYMFSGCESLTSLDVSHFDTGNVTDMSNMFNGCKSLTKLDLSSFDTGSVTKMYYMFYSCANLTTLDLSSFDAGSVTEMYSMFNDCSNLTTIYTPRNVKRIVDLPSGPEDKWYRSDDTVVTRLPLNLDYSVALGRNHTPTEKTPGEDDPTDPMSGKSGNISWEIDANGKLSVSGTGDWESKTVNDVRWTPWYEYRESIKAAEINVTGMTDASYMFAGCGNLTTLDVSNFNTSKVTDMSGMFSNCISLSELDLRSFDASSVTNMSGMFSGCANLTTIYTPRNVTQSVSLPANPGYVWSRSDGTEVTELPRNEKDSILITMIKKPDIPSDDDPKDDNGDGVDDKDIPEDGVIPKGLWISKIEDQTYTGAAIKPEVRVYDGEKRLKEGTDYTLSYQNNTKAAQPTDTKPPTVVVKSKGNYAGTETKTFTIAKRNISDTYVTKVFTDAYAPLANGKNPTLVFSAKCNNKALKQNTDYTLTVKDSAGNEVTSYAAEGSYTAVVKGTGTNYTGEYSFPFAVLNKVPVSKLKVSKIAAEQYDGTPKIPEPVIKYGKVTLAKGTNYSLSYRNNTEMGTATVIVEGTGDYFGTREVTFSITGLQIKKAKFTGFKTSIPYTGDAVYQSEAVLKYEEKNLVKDTDYTVSYSNHLNKGKATVTYTGIGKYTGTVKKTYSITAYNIAKDANKRISLSTDTISAAYTKGGARPSLKVYDKTLLLTEGKDYTLSYQNNTAVTTPATVKQPTITVKGIGNYAGTFAEKKTFIITTKNISEVTVTAPDVAASPQIGKYKSTPVLTDTDGKKLSAGKDYDKTYTYTYKDTTAKVLSDGTEVTRNAGDPVGEKDIVPANTVLCVRIKAKEGSNYTGEKTAEYRIVTSLISKAKITVQNPAQNNANLFPYTGQEIRIDKSNLIVKVGTEVLSGDQYEILEDTYKNNVKKGTASVQIRGVGNYGGTATVKFKIGTKGFRWVQRLFG